MRCRVAVALCVSWVSTLAAEPYKVLPPPDDLNAAVDRDGARAVLSKGLWSDGETPVFDSFLEKVRTGDRQWLRLAARLRSASDAGASEGLDGAMSDALPRAPEEVLRVCTLGDEPGSFSITSICSGRFNLWAEEPPERAQQWYEKAERAISGYRSTELEAKRSACLSEIRQSRQRFLEASKQNKPDR
jgi:hypothetical protein